MDGNATAFLGYGCIVAAIALFWFGRPDRSGEPARWLRGGGSITFLFPVLLMALLVGGTILVVGIGRSGSSPF